MTTPVQGGGVANQILLFPPYYYDVYIEAVTEENVAVLADESQSKEAKMDFQSGC